MTPEQKLEKWIARFGGAEMKHYMLEMCAFFRYDYKALPIERKLNFARAAIQYRFRSDTEAKSSGKVDRIIDELDAYVGADIGFTAQQLAFHLRIKKDFIGKIFGDSIKVLRIANNGKWRYYADIEVETQCVKCGARRVYNLQYLNNRTHPVSCQSCKLK